MSGSDEGHSVFESRRAAERLPSPPGVALRVVELCQAENCQLPDLIEVLNADPVLAARMIKYVNSPLCGVTRPVSSIRQAVLLLGLRPVRMMALGFAVASVDMGHLATGFNLNRFWKESFATAVIASRLTPLLSEEDADEAFTAGLLAGLGQIALAHCLPREYEFVLAAVANGESLIESEREALGVDHCEFGAEFLAEWKLPKRLITVVRCQVDPGTAPKEDQELSKIVSIARALAPVFLTNEPTAEERQRGREMVERELGLEPASWTAVAEDVIRRYREAAVIFDLSIEDGLSLVDLYAEAQWEAAQLGLQESAERRAVEDERDQLLRAAESDSLTGLCNRAVFDRRLESILRSARDDDEDFALVLMDLDNLKQLNDHFGHLFGDQALRATASSLEAVLREGDLLARYGGDEFAAILPRATPEEIVEIAERLVAAARSIEMDLAGEMKNLSISVGVALRSDIEGETTSDMLFAEADKQLYHSKGAGKDCWTFRGESAPPMSSAA
ncbi:MAG: HDOD domain-containing protein [Phycisphaerales bacterium]